MNKSMVQAIILNLHLKGEYIDYTNYTCKHFTLDGNFTAEELEALAFAANNKMDINKKDVIVKL